MMEDNAKSLREGRIKVGFVLPFDDLSSPISRLRGAFPCLALRRLGVQAYVCSPSNALDFDMVVLGRTYYNFKPCIDLLPRLNAAKIPVVFDFCDIIKPYESLSGALLDFLEHCQVATVSSRALLRLYTDVVKTPVLHIDDIVDGAFDAPDLPPIRKPDDSFLRLGWTGLAGNLDLLSPLFPLLHELHEALPGRFKLSLLTSKDLGSRKYPPFEKTLDYLNSSLKVPFEFMEWDIKTCRDVAASQWDVALVPCPDVPKSCNRTLFASFANALPVASDTCDNLHALGEIAPELLLANDSEWFATLQKAILEPEWRLATTAKVKRHLQTRFSAEALGAKWLEALELALTRPMPEHPFAIKPNYPYDKKTFAMEIRAIVLDGWFELRGKGVRKVALYGAGRHSAWLLPLLKDNPRPAITAFIDDNVKACTTFEGCPVMPLSAFDPESMDMIVLNTDSCREAMLKNLHTAGIPETKIFDFYKAFPPGPYPR